MRVYVCRKRREGSVGCLESGVCECKRAGSCVCIKMKEIEKELKVRFLFIYFNLVKAVLVCRVLIPFF